MRWTLSRAAFVALAALLGAAGCGGGLHSVRGKVTFEDGTPLTKGLVLFEGKDGERTITARGDVRPDGSYQLGTNKPGDGAPAGKYRVAVTPLEDLADVDSPRRAAPLDPRFSDFNSSGLEFEVKPG